MLKRVGRCRPRSDLGARLQVDAVCFSVADNGPGIEAGSLHRVFERYWHATRTAGGRMGLSIAKGIVEAHGGRIWVESTVGVGSTF